MFFANFLISFPVYQLTCRTVYAALRKPTVFEESILMLVNNYSDHPQSKTLTLASVFREILNVPESAKLVLPSLQQLIDAGLINSREPVQSLDTVQLEALQLTRIGKEILSKKAFPGQQLTRENRLYYDPIRDLILSEDEQALLTDVAEPVYLDTEAPATTVDHLAQSHIRQLHHTGDAATEILDIKISEMETKWLTREAEVHISESGELSLHFGDILYDDYVRYFNSRWLLENILMELFPEAISSADNKETATPFSTIYKKIEEIFPVTEMDLKLRIRPETIHFFNYQPYLKQQLKPKPNTALIVFGYPGIDEKKPEIFFNEQDKSAVIRLGQSFPIANCQYINAKGENLFSGNFGIVINEEIFTLPIGYRIADRYFTNQQLTGLYQLLNKIIDKTNEVQWQLIKLFWEKPEVVWAKIKEMTS
jgi:hypothetical protein